MSDLIQVPLCWQDLLKNILIPNYKFIFTYPCAGIYWNFPNFNIEFFDVHKKQMETDIELRKRMTGTDENKI